ncbi:MAG: methyl-accepting chemotaxis protein, partial [Clostridium sp.]
MFKFKSLKSRLILSVNLLTIIICLGLALVSIQISKSTISNTIDESLPQVASQAAGKVEASIKEHIATMELLATNPKLSDPNVKLEEKLAILSEESKRSNHTNMTIADVNGDAHATTNASFNISSESTFKDAMQGKSSVSSPIVSVD